VNFIDYCLLITNLFMKQKVKEEIESKTLAVSRVTRVTAGGKQLGFKAVVVVGDRKGSVGLGTGKARDVSLAVEKGINNAKKNMIKIPLMNDTILYDVTAKVGASRVLIRPQFKGKKIVAGSVARAICDLAGIQNISCKILSRSKNKLNNAKALMKALNTFIK
jgi:small subunit ribosomal protein S5